MSQNLQNKLLDVVQLSATCAFQVMVKTKCNAVTELRGQADQKNWSF